ncbi:MAG: hypothetical protein RLY71_3822 [Pseudomonadota bacterium]|jgi:hypothetical protein
MELIERQVPFAADDGMPLNLIQVRGSTPASKGPVLLVHGAGVRANIFRPPVGTSFVEYLVQNGWDVWLENWRASIDLPQNEWTLEQAALYDHPAAVRTVLAETGADTLKAVIHCQGSTSFTMSALAGLVPRVTTIVSNAVSLHPVVKRISQWKSRLAVPLVAAMTPYLDPRWGEHASGLVPQLLRALVLATHHECDNGVCRFSSFTYGTGFPVLWRHENLNEATHDWIRQEFGPVPLTFFRQMGRCIEAGHLVSAQPEALPGLPADYTAHPPRTTARFAFIAGRLNDCFAWQGQRSSHAWFERHQPGRHSLHVLERYGHLDIFLGQNALHDTFPVMLAELER